MIGLFVRINILLTVQHSVNKPLVWVQDHVLQQVALTGIEKTTSKQYPYNDRMPTKKVLTAAPVRFLPKRALSSH